MAHAVINNRKNYLLLINRLSVKIIFLRILPFHRVSVINYKARQALQSALPNTVSMNVGIAVLAGWTASSILYPFDILRQSLGTNTEK